MMPAQGRLMGILVMFCHILVRLMLQNHLQNPQYLELILMDPNIQINQQL